MLFPTIVEISDILPGRKMLLILYGRCSVGGSGQKKGIISCPDGALEAFGAEKGIIFCAEGDTTRMPSRKTPKFLRVRCHGGIWSRKRYHFLRGMGYHSTAEQKNTPISARKVPLRHLEQKKVSFSAQRGPQPRQGPQGR